MHLLRDTKADSLIKAFEEKHRRRTKVIPCFLTEKSALKMVFSVLIRAARSVFSEKGKGKI